MRTFSLGVASMALIWSQGAFAAPPEWKISEVTGTVRLTQQGETRAATRDAVLAPGDVVATSPGARAVIVRGQEYVIVSANTQLRLPAASQSGGVTQIIEDFGNAVYRIAKKATPHFGVETPYLAAVVKGTTFSVTVGSEGASVQVIEGIVEVATSDGGASELIEPGVIALVGASDRYRLTVEGAERRVIDSPARPAETNAPAEAPTSAEPAGSMISAAEDGQLIASPIAEDGPALGFLTDGMVQGDAGIELAFAAVSAAREATSAPEPAPSDGPGNGGGNDNAGPGNNNGGGNDNAGPGNNNGGGNGNAGPGNDNGGGNDNAGPGNDNGGGNDNAGPGNNNGGGNDNAGPGNNNGGGNDNAGPGNNNGGGNDNAGPGNNNGGGNDNSGPGNNNGGGNDNAGPGNNNGGGNDNSGPGNNNGVGNDNAGPGNNNGGGNGHGNPADVGFDTISADMMAAPVPEADVGNALSARLGRIADPTDGVQGRAAPR